jgi:AcrR family transcriptional regulator
LRIDRRLKMAEKCTTVRTKKDRDDHMKQARTAKNSNPGLNEESITIAALALLDEEGLGRFTLRNLATSLGVFPSAIYWYLPSKDDVAAAVIGLILKDVAPAGDPSAWQAYLRALFVNFRAVIRAHPNAAPLVGVQLTANTRADLGMIEGILTALTHAGYAGKALANAYNSTIATMVGFATQEFSGMPEGGEEWQTLARERIEAIPADTYPVVAGNLAHLKNKAFILRWDNGVGAPLDASFAFHIDLFIAGLEAQAKKTVPSKKAPGRTLKKDKAA